MLVLLSVQCNHSHVQCKPGESDSNVLALLEKMLQSVGRIFLQIIKYVSYFRPVILHLLLEINVQRV